MATCRASLDKSGRAGVQKIHLMQPLIDNDFDVGPPLSDFFAGFFGNCWWLGWGVLVTCTKTPESRIPFIYILLFIIFFFGVNLCGLSFLLGMLQGQDSSQRFHVILLG